jgi:hypothetical protein
MNYAAANSSTKKAGGNSPAFGFPGPILND